MAKKTNMKRTTQETSPVSATDAGQKKAKTGKQTGPKTQQSQEVTRQQRQVPQLSYHQIEERAKAIWQASGCQPGRDEHNWYEAEAQLKAELHTV